LAEYPEINGWNRKQDRQKGVNANDGRRPGAGDLSDSQRIDWLRLIRSDNVGPSTFRQLINRFGGASAALEALPGLIAKARGVRAIKLASREDCEREFEALARLGGRFIAMGESAYPPLLRAIDAPPPLIAVLGRIDVLQRPMVAIVGARNASAAGLSMAERLAGELAVHDYTIVSGLARGVDRRAHEASLATGTVAVLAGGFHHIYPAEHKPLAERICEQGALISEMPLTWQARGRDFPRRNRIVSGLAYGTVVVEAARRSGSLITARFANEQGREVFAVPGSPLDPRAEGPNQLLRQGASICLSADSIVEVLAPMREGAPPRGMDMNDPAETGPAAEDLWDETDLFGAVATPSTMAGMELDDGGVDGPADRTMPGETTGALSAGRHSETALSDDETPAERLEALLGPAPVTIDELVRLSGLGVAEVKMVLFDLELDGRLERHGGDLVSLVR
jgi:DNA processing protein